MTTFPKEFATYINRARARYGRLTPFRLGVIVGEAGSDLPNPYPKTGTGHKQFDAGAEHGHKQSIKQRSQEQP